MNNEPSLEELLKNTNKTFEKLYVGYKNDFIHFAKNFSLKEDVILDIYQETFISFYENLLTGKLTSLTSSIKTYIFSIGKYKIYEYIRNNNKIKIIDTEINFEISIDTLDLKNEILTEQEKLVKKNLKKLGKQCQLILELFYLQGKTLNDIKIEKNYENTNVVKSLKSRCLKKLKQLVNG